MPEITQADEVRARHLVPAATTMAMVPVVESRRKELAAAFAAHREAAVAAYVDTTTPPDPRALTAEIVKEMLPLSQRSTRSVCHEGRWGEIEWMSTEHVGFAMQINGQPARLGEFTDKSFAELIAALGIDAGVKHG